jgi:hypothetical protein
MSILSLLAVRSFCLCTTACFIVALGVQAALLVTCPVDYPDPFLPYDPLMNPKAYLQLPLRYATPDSMIRIRNRPPARYSQRMDRPQKSISRPARAMQRNKSPSGLGSSELSS